MGEPSRRIDVSPVVAGILSDGPKFKRFNGWNGSNAGNQVPEFNDLNGAQRLNGLNGLNKCFRARLLPGSVGNPE